MSCSLSAVRFGPLSFQPCLVLRLSDSPSAMAPRKAKADATAPVGGVDGQSLGYLYPAFISKNANVGKIPQ
jgi:hypothetical protein